jgi:hypothetical protein
MKQAFLYPTPELPDDTPLEHVRFSTRIRKALEFGDLKTVGDVRAASDGLVEFSESGPRLSTTSSRNTGVIGKDEMTDVKVRRLVEIGLKAKGT